MYGTNTNIDGFYTKTTQIWGFREFFFLKSVIPTYSIFQHVYGRHNLVSFYGESYFDSSIASSIFILFFFFSEKTLGDISFKLETKIMNFMIGFFFGKNIINTTQLLSIICNTICLQFSHYQAPLQSLALFLLITSRISDFKCHSY